MIARVSGSSLKSRRTSTKLVPVTGSPPIRRTWTGRSPRRELADNLVGQGAAPRHDADGAGRVDMPGMMPIFAWSGVMTPGQFGPISRLASLRGSASRGPCRRPGSLGDADDQGNARRRSFHDRVGRRRRRTKMSAQFAPHSRRPRNRIPHRKPFVGRATFGRRDAADDRRPVLLAAGRVERPSRPVMPGRRRAWTCRPGCSTGSLRQRHDFARPVAMSVRSRTGAPIRRASSCPAPRSSLHPDHDG